MQGEFSLDDDVKPPKLEHENLYISRDHHEKLEKLKLIRKDATIANLRRAAEAEIDRMYRLVESLG